MKVYPSEKIRNVVLVGHQGTGKTSVAERMIYNTGSLSRLGKVDDGNSVSDYLPEEVKKKLLSFTPKRRETCFLAFFNLFPFSLLARTLDNTQASRHDLPKK